MTNDVWQSPPSNYKLFPDMVHAWAISLDRTAEMRDNLWPLLAADEQKRALRFYFDQHRFHFIVARGLLRTILANYLHTAPQTIQFIYGEHGKPELTPSFKENGNQLEFNLSHSKGMALIGVSWNRPLGIDIESVRPLDDGKDIARRFFSKWEYEQFTAVPLSQQPKAFFNCWTRKEAYIKAIGDGLFCPLDSFDVTLTPGTAAKLLRVHGSTKKAALWQLNHLEPRHGFVGAIIAANPKWQLSYFRWPDP
ncbi:MAG: 4'-phosphopantetheinyl transferase superfamily protein [Chloroflexi bacterium]|nr:4'-phosphopantetheinyl transferase superfamily protein [Chloroflexota bacterium]